MSRIPRGVTAREFIPALERDGFVLDRISGSHHVYLNVRGRRVVVACHRMSDGFPIGTLKRMIADSGWDDADLERLNL